MLPRTAPTPPPCCRTPGTPRSLPSRGTRESHPRLWLFDGLQRENGWLGYEPASEEAVRVAEKRLDVRLPPSYRNFLLASNGWRDIDPELSKLFRVDEIGWFAEKDPELLAAWTEAGLDVVEQVKPCLIVNQQVTA